MLAGHTVPRYGRAGTEVISVTDIPSRSNDPHKYPGTCCYEASNAMTLGSDLHTGTCHFGDLLAMLLFAVKNSRGSSVYPSASQNYKTRSWG